MSTLTPPIDDSDHKLGKPEASVTLTEYGDYECPYCGQAYILMQQVLAKYGDVLLFTFRNFPLSQAHPHALIAAQAAEAAAVQGSFWPMHDLLYENQHALAAHDLLGYATRLRLDVERFARELKEETHRPKVERDFRSGVRSGVNGTPTFFLDNERLDSWDIDTLESAIMRKREGKRRHARGG